MASTTLQMQDMSDDGTAIEGGDPPQPVDGGTTGDPAESKEGTTGGNADASVDSSSGGDSQGPESEKRADPVIVEAAIPVTTEAAVPEKLADDVIRPPLWKRVVYGVFPALEKSE